MMLIEILYVIVSFIATVIGSMTGIGGGIILKAFADIFSTDPIVVVSFYTTVVVFTMCVVSIYKQWRKGFKFEFKMLLAISGGSLLGGYFGELALNTFTSQYDPGRVQFVQSIILALTLLFLLIYTKKRTEKSKDESPNLVTAALLGLFLGTISIFLGIGGGPLNVSLMVILFGYSMKEAAIYSLATVFFSQIAKIVSIALSAQYQEFDLQLIPFLIVSAIFGGYLGTILNQQCSSKRIEMLYTMFMIGILALTVFNVVRYA